MSDSLIKLAQDSDSTIIILLLVIGALVIASIPVIKTFANIETSKRKQDYEREGRLIEVIEKNTEVNSALKTLIEKDQKYCDLCKSEQFGLLRKVFDNQEIANMKLVEISQKIERDG